ncbi:MAG: hypothetical protein AB2797_12980 [Candidatus Thiodiazotropha sp.]
MNTIRNARHSRAKRKIKNTIRSTGWPYVIDEPIYDKAIDEMYEIAYRVGKRFKGAAALRKIAQDYDPYISKHLAQSTEEANLVNTILYQELTQLSLFEEYTDPYKYRIYGNASVGPAQVDTEHANRFGYSPNQLIYDENINLTVAYYIIKEGQERTEEIWSGVSGIHKIGHIATYYNSGNKTGDKVINKYGLGVQTYHPLIRNAIKSLQEYNSFLKNSGQSDTQIKENMFQYSKMLNQYISNNIDWLYLSLKNKAQTSHNQPSKRKYVTERNINKRNKKNPRSLRKPPINSHDKAKEFREFLSNLRPMETPAHFHNDRKMDELTRLA